MVPCPEEHVEEVTHALMRLTLGMAGWDDDGVETFVAQLQPAERELVTKVAEVSVEHDLLPYTDAAARLGTDVGSVLGMVTTINDRCTKSSLPPPLITDTVAVAGPSGKPAAAPALVIVRGVAVRMLERLAAAGSA